MTIQVGLKARAKLTGIHERAMADDVTAGLCIRLWIAATNEVDKRTMLSAATSVVHVGGSG